MIKYIKSRLWLLMTSTFISKIITTFFIRDGFIKTSAGWIKVGNIPTKPISLLFWGLYEREDIYFVKKYLNKNIPVIELGASLGVITSNICNIINKKVPIIAIEANPNLFNNLIETKEKNNFENLQIISAAVDYSESESIGFIVDKSSLNSKKGNSGNVLMVPTIKLSDIINGKNINEYSLVCDIEGAEVELFSKEKDERTLTGCKTLIIELHETMYNGVLFRIKDIIELIETNFLMKLIAQDKTTFVFNKTNGR